MDDLATCTQKFQYAIHMLQELQKHPQLAEKLAHTRVFVTFVYLLILFEEDIIILDNSAE